MSAEDILALQRTAAIYARGADRRCKADWEAVLTDDVVMWGPGFSMEGREAALGSIDMLGQMFKATRHLVHNQTAEIKGDHAVGETYCTAEHKIAGENGDMLLCWGIRYQDEWRRESGEWRISRRELVLDWEELRPVKMEASQ